MAIRFPTGANFLSSSALHYHRSTWSLEDASGASQISSSCRLLHSGRVDVQRKRCRELNSECLTRRNNLMKNRVRACAESLGSASDPAKKKGKPRYHPSEDFVKSTSEDDGDIILTAAETSRTIIEVNSKATLMFSSLVNDEVQENTIWPELPYVIDEHGNIYFQVKNSEETMQNLTSENNFVQVIIGLDTTEMINELELSGPSEVEFGIEEIDDEGSDVEDDDDDDEEDNEDDDHDTDWVAVLDDENNDDSDEDLGDWAKLETMRSSHPLFFAKKLSEVASDDTTDWMEQPPASLAIQGVLRPAFSEEHSVIQKHLSKRQSSKADASEVEKIEENNPEYLDRINGHGPEPGSPKDSMWAEGSEEDVPVNETSFYKLEMIKIQLYSVQTRPAVVEVEDYLRAQPDAIAHSAGKIISRIKAVGEKATQALKSLCWRSKGIQVEEATLIAVDSLGFDLRVCSGTQVQTLRFAFNTRATSEYSAERQLNDILFPRIHPKQQKKIQTQQNEC